MLQRILLSLVATLGRLDLGSFFDGESGRLSHFLHFQILSRSNKICWWVGFVQLARFWSNIHHVTHESAWGSDELSWGSNGHHIKQLEFIGQEVTISTSPLSASASARIWGRLGLMTSKTHETKEEANEGKSHHRSVWSMLVQHSAAWEKNWSKVQGSCIDKCNDNSFPPMISKLMLQFASSAKTVCWLDGHRNGTHKWLLVITAASEIDLPTAWSWRRPKS